MPDSHRLIAVVHADESCLGNGRDGQNPGGAGSLVEMQIGGRIHRTDIHISSPDTTNNRMALSGAIATLALLREEYGRLAVVLVSDSQYLVKGMNEWMPHWRARGWKRKKGAVENVELWKQLERLSKRFDPEPIWRWVRGHDGHPKNEYANDLAMKAAKEQALSEGAVESLFDDWLAQKKAKGEFADYDPDQHLMELASLVH